MNPRPMSHYAVQKLASEYYCDVYRRLYGLEAICLRYFNVFGPRQRFDSPYSGVIARFMHAGLRREPMTVLWVSLLALALFATYYGVTVLLFLRAGREQALALGIMTSLRNLGLLIAATGGAIPELSWIYFAASQIPIHLAPALLKWLAARNGTA